MAKVEVCEAHFQIQSKGWPKWGSSFFGAESQYHAFIWIKSGLRQL